jgi:hypothetical protein
MFVQTLHESGRLASSTSMGAFMDEWIDSGPKLFHKVLIASGRHSAVLDQIRTERAKKDDSRVGEEAAMVGVLYRDISSFPEPTRTELQTDLRQYTRQVIDAEKCGF